MPADLDGALALGWLCNQRSSAASSLSDPVRSYSTIAQSHRLRSRPNRSDRSVDSVLRVYFWAGPAASSVWPEEYHRWIGVEFARCTCAHKANQLQIRQQVPEVAGGLRSRVLLTDHAHVAVICRGRGFKRDGDHSGCWGLGLSSYQTPAAEAGPARRLLALFTEEEPGIMMASLGRAALATGQLGVAPSECVQGGVGGGDYEGPP